MKVNLDEKPVFYVIGTPIGNLKDITLRALEVLKEVDFIVCEDTRKTKILLQKYNILTPLKSYRQYNKENDIEWILQKLSIGCDIAFTTDAGTPSISDPGADIVRNVKKNDIANIVPIPGVSALSTILSVCGWQTNPTYFCGFLSNRQGRCRKALEDLASFSGILILYESVYRLRKTMRICREIFYDRDILIAREMSKIYEEFILLKSVDSEDWDMLIEKVTLKGEFTIAIAPIRKASRKD